MKKHHEPWLETRPRLVSRPNPKEFVAMIHTEGQTEMKYGTQNERLLNALLQGQKITPLDSWIQLGIYRLASRIHDLRDGKLNRTRYQVKKEMVEVQNQWGDTATVAAYYLDREQIAHYLKQVTV
jgi:hypothetical protein